MLNLVNESDRKYKKSTNTQLALDDTKNITQWALSINNIHFKYNFRDISK